MTVFFSLTSALWLNLLATPAVADNEHLNEKIFLQAAKLTEIRPLRLQFFKGEVHLTDDNQKMILEWAKQIIKYNIPVFIHSFATAPGATRDQTNDTARHEAIRIAFNRALLAKNFLEQSGIAQNRLILKASGSEHSEDAITITMHRDN